jgi:hypothetical protein
MLRSSLSSLVRSTPLRWYLRNKIMRMQLVQHAIDALAARTYLEIGVDEGESFCAVRVPRKTGVDPVPPKPRVAVEITSPGVQYFAMTSDEFFASDARDAALAGGVDVVFVDGLHTYGQTYRDVRNSLKVLNPGGVILVHDCLPASEEEARVAATYEEAGRLNGPSWNGLWTGDGWKAIVAVRSGHDGADACVLDCDHGVGLVYHGGGRPPLRLSLEEIDALDYAALAADPQRLLGLSAPARLQSVLRTMQSRRRPS